MLIVARLGRGAPPAPSTGCAEPADHLAEIAAQRRAQHVGQQIAAIEDGHGRKLLIVTNNLSLESTKVALCK